MSAVFGESVAASEPSASVCTEIEPSSLMADR